MATGTINTLSDTAGAGKLRVISLSCVANASGVVITDKIAVDGVLVLVETIPNTVAVPTSYNLQARRGSSTGFDMLGGSGAFRSTTLTEEARPKDAAGNLVLASFRGGNGIFITADTVGNGGKFTVNLHILQEA